MNHNKKDLSALPFAGAKIGAGVIYNSTGKPSFIKTISSQDGINLSNLDKSYNNSVMGIYGSSDYVNTKDGMEISVSGSVKAKILGCGLGAEAGFSKATSNSNTTKQVSVTYYHASIAARETIELQEISLNQLIQSLKPSTKSLLTQCFEAHDKCFQTEKNNKTGFDKEAVRKWRALVNKFYKNYGEEVVLGIVWGTLGLVEASIEKSDSDKKKASDFKATISAGGITASGSISTNLKKNDSTSKADMSYTISGTSYGDASKKFVTAWIGEINKAASGDLTDIKPMNLADKVSVSTVIPTPPELKAPKAKSSLASAFGKVKTKEEMKNLIYAQGYDKWSDSDDSKGTEKSITDYDNYLEELKETRKTATKALSQRIGWESLDNEAPLDLSLLSNKLNNSNTSTLLQSPSPSSSLAGNFVPLGIYTSNWANLFPCLSYSKFDGAEVSDIDLIKESLLRRSRISSLKALCQNYSLWSDPTTIPVPYYTKNKCMSLATDFQSCLNYVRKNPEKATDKNIKEKLSPEGSLIYDKWIKTPALNEAELGFGALVVAYTNSKKEKIKSVVAVKSFKFRLKSSFTAATIEPDINGYFPPEQEFTGKLVPSTFNAAMKVFPKIITLPNNSTHIAGFTFLPDFNPPIFLGSPNIYTNEAPCTLFTPKKMGLLNKRMGWSDDKEVLHSNYDIPSMEGSVDIVLIPLSSGLAEGIEWKGPKVATDMYKQAGKSIDELIKTINEDDFYEPQDIGIDEEDGQSKYLDWQFKKTKDENGNEAEDLDATFQPVLFEDAHYYGLVPKQ